jgi:hypothetical protein
MVKPNIPGALHDGCTKISKAHRLRSLRNRLAILDNVRGALLTEIELAERDMPSLIRSDSECYLRAASPSAIRSDHDWTIARKALCSAVETLARGDFGYGLQTALMLLVMTAPGDEPRAHRDEILYAAVVQAGADAPDIKPADKKRLFRDLRQRFGFIHGTGHDTQGEQDKFRAAVARGRKKSRKG